MRLLQRVGGYVTSRPELALQGLSGLASRCDLAVENECDVRWRDGLALSLRGARWKARTAVRNSEAPSSADPSYEQSAAPAQKSWDIERWEENSSARRLLGGVIRRPTR